MPRVFTNLVGRGSFVRARNAHEWDPLPLSGIIWYTWNQSDVEDLSACEAAPMEKGYNYALIKSILAARILARSGVVNSEIEEIDNAVWLHGEVVIDLLSMMDVVFVGHWIPGYHAQQIKSRSTAPEGTKIYLWTNFETESQGVIWAPSQGNPRTYLSGYPISATSGTNAWGCTIIDQYEASAWTYGNIGCPHTPLHNQPNLTWPAAEVTTHTFAVDMYTITGNADFLSNDMYTLALAYNSNAAANGRKASGKWWVDGLMFDNVMDRPLKGTSTSMDWPATWTADRYAESWKAFLNGMRYWNSQLPDPDPTDDNYLFGNCDDSSRLTYTRMQLPNRYEEWFFIKYPGPVLKRKTDIFADLQLISTMNTRVILGPGSGSDEAGIQSWCTSTGAADTTWKDIAIEAKRLGITKQIFVPFFRTNGTGTFIMWQDVFRRPR